MTKDEMLDLARRMGVPLRPEDAEARAADHGRTKQVLEAMKRLPLEGVEPPHWFVPERRS